MTISDEIFSLKFPCLKKSELHAVVDFIHITKNIFDKQIPKCKNHPSSNLWEIFVFTISQGKHFEWENFHEHVNIDGMCKVNHFECEEGKYSQVINIESIFPPPNFHFNCFAHSKFMFA